ALTDQHLPSIFRAEPGDLQCRESSPPRRRCARRGRIPSTTVPSAPLCEPPSSACAAPPPPTRRPRRIGRRYSSSTGRRERTSSIGTRQHDINPASQPLSGNSQSKSDASCLNGG